MQWDDSELRSLQADLGDAGPRVGKEVADVLRKNGELLKRNISSRSPVRTGALAKSWTVKASGDGRSAGMSVTVESTLRQAFFQEHGTSVMSAQPSAGPGLEATAPAYVADMERVGEELLD